MSNINIYDFRHIIYFLQINDQKGGGSEFKKYLFGVFKKNIENKEDECVSISKKKHIASININGDSEYCGTTITTSIGSHLLKIAIKFITEYKNKFNVKKIQLSNHAEKTCPNAKKRINLSEFLILTGDTWDSVRIGYGRNGFTPQIEKDLILYNNNRQIMKIVKISDL